MTFKRGTLLKFGGGLIALAGLGFVVLTSPWTWSVIHPSRDLPQLQGADLENGRKVFVASHCATCHTTPGQDNVTVLGGGRALDTQFGIFHMPNISPDKTHGIGNWTLAEFDRALRQGVGPGGLWPDGRNLYPAFPYTSYQRLKGEDVRDLYAYIMTLPPQQTAVREHEMKFPFNIRRGVGIWRLAFLDGKPFKPGAVPAGVDAATYHQGEYLVEAAGHCAECHSPRTIAGNVPSKMRYAGGPNTDGTGWFPNITPDETGIGYWSAASIANYLHTGVSPIGRTAAGDMGEVIQNTSQLPLKDVQAMTLYIKHLPAVDHPAPGVPEPNRTNQLVMLKDWVRAAPKLPASAPAAIKQGDQATVVATKNAWLVAGDVGGSTEAQGKFLGGAEVTVVKREGDKTQLTLNGWQTEGATSVVYQAKGQRVMMAVLSSEAAAKVTPGTPEKDADTGQTWTPVELTLWSDANGLNTDRAAVWAYSHKTFQTTCSACHVLPQQEHYTANQWIGTLKAMRRFTSFSDDQYRLILAYLQNHSKDLNPSEAAAK